MKVTRTFLLLFFIFHFLPTRAQDTILVYNNFKYKIGAKFIGEMSGDLSLIPESIPVYSGGFQIIRKFGNSRSSFESGVYMISKSLAQFQNTIYGIHLFSILYRNVSVPLNYRFDTKVFYISGGPFIDYLVAENGSNWKNYSPEFKYSRKLNFGLNIILGIEKSISKKLSLMVEGRYFNTLSSSSIGRGIFGPSYLNYGFAIGINYKILRDSRI